LFITLRRTLVDAKPGVFHSFSRKDLPRFQALTLPGYLSGSIPHQKKMVALNIETIR